MRTALQLTQRRATLAREIARYRARLEEIGAFPITPQERRTFTMARNSLKRHYRDLGEIAFEEQVQLRPIAIGCEWARGCAMSCCPEKKAAAGAGGRKP